MIEAYEDRARRGGDEGVRQASLFLDGRGPVHETLRRISVLLETLGIPYAVTGGMALVAHGYNQATVDVDVVVSAEGLARLRALSDETGDFQITSDGRQSRDLETGVRIDLVVNEGDFESSCVRVDGIRYVGLQRLIEAKLTLGMKSGRLKHLADAQELIKELKLPLDLGVRLDPYVRPEYEKLWKGAHESP